MGFSPKPIKIRVIFSRPNVATQHTINKLIKRWPFEPYGNPRAIDIPLFNKPLTPTKKAPYRRVTTVGNAYSMIEITACNLAIMTLPDLHMVGADHEFIATR